MKLLGPQDFSWWSTMVRNEHLLAAACAHMVTIPARPEHEAGLVVACGTGAIGWHGQHLGPHGVIISTDTVETVVKVLGPAIVQYETNTPHLQELAVIQANGKILSEQNPDASQPVLGDVFLGGDPGNFTTWVNVGKPLDTDRFPYIPAPGKKFVIAVGSFREDGSIDPERTTINVRYAEFVNGELIVYYTDNIFDEAPIPTLGFSAPAGASPVLKEYTKERCVWLFRNHATYLNTLPGKTQMMAVGVANAP